MSGEKALYELTAHELSDLLQSKQISAGSGASLYAGWTRPRRPLHAYILLTRGVAEQQAAAVATTAGEGRGPAAPGRHPHRLKDIYCTEGIETTCCSRILEGFVPPYDAEVVRALPRQRAPLPGQDEHG